MGDRQDDDYWNSKYADKEDCDHFEGECECDWDDDE